MGSEHRKLTEHDEETGEPYDVCPSCSDDWPCVYAERDQLKAESERLRDIVKEAWRFWADMQDTVVRPNLDRGYVLLRVRGDRYDAFDALFRVSRTLEADAQARRATDGGRED